MRPMLGRTRTRALSIGLASIASALSSLCFTSEAAAYDVLATPCASDPLTCATAPIKFAQVDAVPIQWSFDTGWVPSGSAVQVDVYAHVYANTHVSLSGALNTTWPEALTLATPGDRSGGDFGFHYGADFGAQGKVQISILGKSYSWTGDLPFVPKFDFQVEADQTFDAWGYAPGIYETSTTDPQELASISVGDLIGGSIPGIDGGFELDVAVTLDATYTTERIVLQTTDGNPVSGGDITSQDGTSLASYMGGPNIELDVHPEGNVAYDGVVHLIPTFYVSLLGKKWSIPVVDIPISFPITTNEWKFDPQRVHVPLPDLSTSVTSIDFGEVEVGTTKQSSYKLWNAGEAIVSATVLSSSPDTFAIDDTQTETIDPTETVPHQVKFVPPSAGEFSAKVTIASNDPDQPLQTIVVTGIGVEKPVPPEADAGTDDGDDGDRTKDPKADGSCGCRVGPGADAQSNGGAGAALGLVALAALFARGRRKG